MRAYTKAIQALVVAGLMSIATIQLAHAGLTNDVPSCYTANQIAQRGVLYDQLIYVLVDQTVQLDPSLQKQVLDNTRAMLTPGTKFVVAEFSAFSQGHYLNVLHTGIIERPIPASEEGDVVMSRLRNFHTCLQQQQVYAQRLAVGSTAEVMKSSTSTLAQSDIMMALKTVSTAVALEKAAHKVVFVVTDGLENSSVTSFYAHDAVRNINPAVELKKAQDNSLLGDFSAARIFVIGGGVMQPATSGSTAARNGYRDPRTLMNLKQFWTSYFQRSNAQLVEFGEPALLESLSY